MESRDDMLARHARERDELTDSDGGDIPPTIENARLHATAPELLEALEGMVNEAYFGIKTGHWLGKAKSAIAKARGEK